MMVFTLALFLDLCDSLFCFDQAAEGFSIRTIGTPLSIWLLLDGDSKVAAATAK